MGLRILGANRAQRQRLPGPRGPARDPFLGIGRDREQPRLPRRAQGAAGIQRDHAIFPRQQRVDAEGQDFGEIDRDLGQADQRILHRLHRRRRMVAVARQQPPGAGTADQPLGQRIVQRRQVEGLIPQQIGRRAPQPEADEGPEHRILPESEAQLRPRPFLPLHQEALDPGLGAQARGMGEHRRRRIPDRRRAPQAERDAADLGLATDIRAAELEHHREAERGGGGHRLLPTRRHAAARHRQPIGREDRQRLILRQFAPSCGAETREQRGDGGAVGR